MMDTTIARTVHATRIGNLVIEASDAGLTRVAFTEETEAPAFAATGTAHAHVVDARSQIDEYLAGLRRAFTVPVDWSGTTRFDADVLRDVLATTGYGETTTYGAIAQRMGRTAADARKVGGALARNRVLIVVPCHRVLAADGALTGYAGGMAAKRALLDVESSDARLALEGI
ncbi:methylated-DNA--[protein]-cysteine S-methyltransferase [Mycobacterium sp. URHB0044]|jgi:methylated-DNA-[protein]-cysteine S-methyltransferase|uniref:methylated-DNA--[protein]-cysteine S-methyltransferase n=1 Tax=Mycobacterium sp. URHB0044 TaxID=1380386 RepID=UPI00056B9F76|nr:methylated-DNA--[protein]-cysteine S-methyltransferase [Mycobacterium sp. URHB0044]